MSRDRFTERDEEGKIRVEMLPHERRFYMTRHESDAVHDADFLYGPAIDRLAEYENLIFSPETLKAIIKEWKEWADAKNDGRLLILPCKVGDTVFATNVSFSFSPYIRCVVIGFQISTFEKEEKLFVELEEIDPPCASLFVSADDFGKTVFMNEGEAVTMLKLTKKERKHEL